MIEYKLTTPDGPFQVSSVAVPRLGETIDMRLSTSSKFVGEVIAVTHIIENGVGHILVDAD